MEDVAEALQWDPGLVVKLLGTVNSAAFSPGQRAISFTCGMLQDMAIPVLAHGHGEKYGPVLERWHAEKAAKLAELEQASLGWSYDAVGSRLARRWDLPGDLVAGIERHHTDAATDRELPPALRLVSVLRETHPEFGLECLIETARSDYGLAPDWTRGAVAESEGHARDLAALLS